MEAAHVLFIFLQQSQHIVWEYGWVVRLELGRHRWVLFHLPRSAALHLCRAPSSSSEVWIQVKMKLEKLKIPWLILEISTEWQSIKPGKQYKQVYNCLFQQLKLTRMESGFFSRSWQLCGCGVPIWLKTSMFGWFQNCHYGRNMF